MIRERNFVATAGFIGLALFAMLPACEPSSQPNPPTQAAVSGALRRVSNLVDRSRPTTPTANEVVSAELSARVRTMPAVRIEGSGTAARVVATNDAFHHEVQSTRAGQGWAMTWSDEHHKVAVLARADEQGNPQGEPVLIRQVRSDEEEVWSASPAFNGSEFGVAWSDPANGRLYFSRFDASGRPQGATTVVHEGLEMPLATRVTWTGTEYAVAVGMAQGVFVARVDRQGAAIGSGNVIAEGETVTALEHITATPAGFVVAWQTTGNARREVRVSRDLQRIEAVPAAGVRVAMR